MYLHPIRTPRLKGCDFPFARAFAFATFAPKGSHDRRRPLIHKTPTARSGLIRTSTAAAPRPPVADATIQRRPCRAARRVLIRTSLRCREFKCAFPMRTPHINSHGLTAQAGAARAQFDAACSRCVPRPARGRIALGLCQYNYLPPRRRDVFRRTRLRVGAHTTC